MKVLKSALTAGFLASSLLFTGCKGGSSTQSPLVKGVELTTTLEDDSDVYLNLSAVFQLGKLTITGDRLEIKNPYDSSIKYGELIFDPIEGQEGYNRVGVKLNLSDVAHVEGGMPTLPNGEDLPIGSTTEHSQMYELSIPQINSKIYIGLGKDMTILGFAIAIKEFDIIGDSINGANVFLGFNIKGVQGNAGLFTGTGHMESGLGFFVDLSSVVTIDMLNDILEGKEVTPERFEAMKVALEEMNEVNEGKYLINRAVFKNTNYTKRNLRKIYKSFKKLGKREVSL